jgi:oligopeptide transport system substrate-binding protein
MTLLKLWRILPLSLLVMAAVVAFSACGDDDSDDATTAGATTPAGTTTPAAGERIEGGTLTVQTREFQSLDPHFSFFPADVTIERMLWRGLYMLDQDIKPQPMMAEALPQISDDGKTYTITVRSGLKWSDGQPLTATDFEAGIKRTCNPVVAGNIAGFLAQSVTGCEDFFAALGTEEAPKTPTPAELQALEDKVGAKAQDDTTLVITLNAAQPTFTVILSMWLAFPVPMHLERFASQTPDKPADWGVDPKGLVYNGPYVLNEYKLQDSATLAPNQNWAGEIQPTLDNLVLKFIDKDDVADNAYRTGELDEAYADVANLVAVKSEFGAEYFQQASPGTRALLLNLKRPPLDKLEVRLALSQAIDRDQLSAVLGGAYQPTTTWLPEGTGGSPPDAFQDEIGLNPTEAQANLSKAGFPNGEGFPKLTMIALDSPEAQTQAQFLQNSFKTVLNIDVGIEALDTPTRSERTGNGDFDMSVRAGWLEDYPDPEDWFINVFNTGGAYNFGGCNDPEVDALIENAQFNPNDAERRDQYKQVNNLIVTKLCSYVPYYHEANNWLVKPYVVGMTENSSAQMSTIPGDWIAEAWGRTE